MKKTLLFLCLVWISIQTTEAQSQTISDAYLIFKIDRTDDSKRANTRERALELLKQASELDTVQIASLNFSIAHGYESEGRLGKAAPYYEEVIKLIPGYYVPYRALAYYNLRICETLEKKVTESIRLKDNAMNKTSLNEYNMQAKKTITYFEKTLACDTDDDTSRDILISLYKRIKAPELLTSLPSRLKALAANCITLLDD